MSRSPSPTRTAFRSRPRSSDRRARYAEEPSRRGVAVREADSCVPSRSASPSTPSKSSRTVAGASTNGSGWSFRSSPSRQTLMRRSPTSDQSTPNCWPRQARRTERANRQGRRHGIPINQCCEGHGGQDDEEDHCGTDCRVRGDAPGESRAHGRDHGRGRQRRARRSTRRSGGVRRRSKGEVKSIDDHLVRLREMEKLNWQGRDRVKIATSTMPRARARGHSRHWCAEEAAAGTMFTRYVLALPARRATS
jgi:hypothetical protein